MNRVLVFVGIILCGGYMVGCSSDKSSEKAKDVYERAEKAMEHKQYAKARAGLDSINRLYPMAIDVRENAIVLKSRITLKEAQDSLQHADSLLQVAKTKGAPSQVIAMRQQHFDMLCMKVRFYYKKIDKLNALKARMNSESE